jgi:hypothetical protein
MADRDDVRVHDHAADDAEELPAVDTPPAEWKAWDGSVTLEEAEEGERLGRRIDMDDDTDTGLEDQGG